MARYEHLPIYKKAMTLSLYLQDAVRQFSRYDKYTIGSDLRDLSRKIIFFIIRANSVQEKEPVLRELVIHCEMLKTLLFFAKEAEALSSFESFRHASGLAVSLCKQSEGWLKSSRRKA